MADTASVKILTFPLGGRVLCSSKTAGRSPHSALKSSVGDCSRERFWTNQSYSSAAWTVYRPPGYIVIDVGVEPIDGPPESLGVEGRVIDLITPETATTSHYFWAFARNFRLDEPAVTEFLRENVGHTFDEDKDMLEAQQRVLGSETEPVFQVAIKADAGPTQGRRLLASMLEGETRGS